MAAVNPLHVTYERVLSLFIEDLPDRDSIVFLGMMMQLIVSARTFNFFYFEVSKELKFEIFVGVFTRKKEKIIIENGTKPSDDDSPVN